MPTQSTLAAAVGIAGIISAVSWRVGSLTASGALAALVVGTAAISAGPAWGAFLIVWFLSASLLSRVGRAAKARHVHGIVAKPGARDARQVLANGLVFAGCAITMSVVPDPRVAVAAAGALGAAGADTWATEFGTWRKSDAWSLRTARWVPAGTSGAISAWGTLAMFAGALLYALLALSLGLVESDAWTAVVAGGVAGAVVDSLIGAWWQERRWCDTCNSGTEQPIHQCGTATRVVGGRSSIDNDLVNLAATIAGAAMAFGLVT